MYQNDTSYFSCKGRLKGFDVVTDYMLYYIILV